MGGVRTHGMAAEKSKDDGTELFRQLQRLLPTSLVEDYHKNGSWQKELLKIDVGLIEAHRNEAGAPDPPPLEDIPEPVLPRPMMTMMPGVTAFTVGMPIKPINVAAGMVNGSRGPTPRVVPPVGAVPLAAATGAAAEIRQIALFVSKWRLEPTKTKLLLAPLPSAKRRWLMENFKYEPRAEMTSVQQLEEFVMECEATGAWGAAEASSADSASAASSAAARASTCVEDKRPATTPATGDADETAKRQKLAASAGFEGVWTDGGDKTMGTIAGQRLTWPSGRQIEFVVASPTTCTINEGAMIYTGELLSDGRLRWSDGDTWTHQSRTGAVELSAAAPGPAASE